MSSKLTTTLTATAIACALAAPAHAVLNISSAKTKGVTCSGGVCTATTRNANLNVGDLQAMLAASDVAVESTAVATDIGVIDAITWASTSHLTLDAHNSIHVRAPVVVEGTAGITLISNDGGTGGDYTFNTSTAGAITFWDMTSSLVINGQSFTLVKDIKTLANDIASNKSGNYALAANYDASVDGIYLNAPVAAIAGIFDGLGNTISNLKINARTQHKQAAAAGLFAVSTGTLRDIALANVDISSRKSSRGFAGALVVINNANIAYATVSGKVSSAVSAGGLVAVNNGTITHSSATGTVASPFGAAGGLVDANSGSIDQSSSDATVTGQVVGGLVYISSGQISASHAGGFVNPSGAGIAGGLVGANSGRIIGSYATGDVGVICCTGIAGGLVGNNDGDGSDYIFQCHASGNVVGSLAGGLVGINHNSSSFKDSKPVISQSYATGSVSTAVSGAEIGGFVGANMFGDIDHSYATGPVTDSSGDTSDLIGGFAGMNSKRPQISQSYSTGLVSSSGMPAHRETPPGGFLGRDIPKNGSYVDYWDFDTSGITNPAQGAGFPSNDPGIAGLTDAQLKSALPTGFDPNVWGQSANINNGWPYLLANLPQQ